MADPNQDEERQHDTEEMSTVLESVNKPEGGKQPEIQDDAKEMTLLESRNKSHGGKQSQIQDDAEEMITALESVNKSDGGKQPQIQDDAEEMITALESVNKSEGGKQPEIQDDAEEMTLRESGNKSHGGKLSEETQESLFPQNLAAFPGLCRLNKEEEEVPSNDDVFLPYRLPSPTKSSHWRNTSPYAGEIIVLESVNESEGQKQAGIQELDETADNQKKRKRSKLSDAKKLLIRDNITDKSGSRSGIPAEPYKPYTCKKCGDKFTSCQALGGHKGKRHPKIKLGTRDTGKSGRRGDAFLESQTTMPSLAATESSSAKGKAIVDELPPQSPPS